MGPALTFLPKTQALRRGKLSFALALFFLVTSTEPWWYSGDQQVCRIAGQVKQRREDIGREEPLVVNRHWNLLRKKFGLW